VTTPAKLANLNRAFVEYYRCPESFAQFSLAPGPSGAPGYFRFGGDAICYGRCTGGQQQNSVTGMLYDAWNHIDANMGLPFDPQEVVDNLRRERYATKQSEKEQGLSFKSVARSTYYLLRPLMPVSFRRHLQKLSLRGWDEIPFPSWPVDTSVECIHEKLIALSLRTEAATNVPFIWFWPDGYSSASIMTHDVETQAGRDFCATLMNMNDEVGIRSSFQIIPEERYSVPASFLSSLRNRGFEINVHDFNHDGHLFGERQRFLVRADRINAYGRAFEAEGFRSGALYRNPDWLDALQFSYDMSFPNVAHLDPQRGGCCTVMPFFIGNILELPLTCTQDYSLFHILGNFSLDLWEKQTERIMEKHGLISFIVHPDYIIDTKPRRTYLALLNYLAKLRSDRRVWIALPGEVNRWWRQRKQMDLVRTPDGYRVEGPGSERALVAYASLDGDRLTYTVEESRRTVQALSA